MIQINPEFLQEWKDKITFAKIFNLQGEVFRAQLGRRTVRFDQKGKKYFVKIHTGIGWREIFKNLFNLRWPVVSARNEWEALDYLNRINISTMKMVAYGCRGMNPAKLKSFIITEELTPTISLEDFCKNWINTPPPRELKRALIKQVAMIARKLHENGLNHRDFYLCHFLLDTSASLTKSLNENLKLYLIDLHRMQIRSATPLRWRIKDIAGLYFSSLKIGLTKRDLLFFIRIYSNQSLKKIFSTQKIFWQRVEHRAFKLAQKTKTLL